MASDVRRAVKLVARVKSDYGPMLPDLVRGRFGVLPGGARTALGVAALALVAVIVAVSLGGGSSSVSANVASLRVSFRYAGLRRETAPAGDVIALASYNRARLVAQILVAQLHLPHYVGDATGVEPLVAASYMRSLAARTPGLQLENTGPTIVNGTAGYDFTYTRALGGETYFGRVIFLTPSLSGARQGVIVSLLAQPVRGGIIGSGKSNLAAALYEPGQGGVGVLFQPSGLLSEPLATLRISSG